MYIQKLPKPKDAVRINSERDIPEQLRDTISVKNGEIEMVCAEGIEHAPLGMVVGFEMTDKTQTGFGAWPISDESRIIEDKETGIIYARPKVSEAVMLTDLIPTEIGEKMWRNEDGSISLQTDWGISTANPGDALIIKYGEGDYNLLTIDTPSYHDYMTCTADGQNIEPLSTTVDRMRGIELDVYQEQGPSIADDD